MKASRQEKEKNVFNELDSIFLVAHQLKAPLAKIKWTLRMLIEEDLGAINEEQKEFLENAYQASERIINLVNDLLDISRISKGNEYLDLKKVDLLDLVKKEVDFYKKEGEKKNISFIFKKPLNKEKFIVKIDFEKIRIVIDNLIRNAIKYTPKGGKIVISLKKRKKEIEFSIKDNGIGIPQDQQDKIFRKFFRADNGKKIDTTGSGLGLYIAKSIIEAHNGRIWFESEENKGTTFYFTLPIKS